MTPPDPDRDNQERAVCQHCNGTGWDNPASSDDTCPRCYGTGNEPQQHPQPTQEEALF